MSIKQATFYAIQCDYPGCTYDTSDLGEYSAWMHLSDAVEEWQSADMLIVKNGPDDKRFYCDEHWMWSEDEDEMIPLPEGIEGEFILAERRIRRVIGAATERALTAHHRRCSDWMHRDHARWQRWDRAREEEAVTARLRESIARTLGIPVELITPTVGYIPAWKMYDAGPLSAP